MAGIRGEQIRDGEIGRPDLNTSEVGQAVITKVIAGTNITISSTGADSGTGDVTISSSGGAAPEDYIAGVDGTRHVYIGATPPADTLGVDGDLWFPNASGIDGGGGDHPDAATHDAMGLATDAELSAHATDTTAVHGITDTSALATDSDVTAAVSAHTGTATGAHAATAISVADAGARFTATEVEGALTETYDLASGKAASGHDHDATYVNEADHTKAAHDALNIDADTLDGIDSTGFAPADPQIFYVMDYGADDTGVADSVAAINAAIAAAVAAGGGTIQFPEGTFRMASEVAPTGLDGIFFRGAGRSLTKLLRDDNAGLHFYFTDCHRVEFHDIWLQGAGIDGLSGGIYWRRVNNTNIQNLVCDDVLISDTGNSAFAMNAAIMSRFINCEARSIAGNGFDMFGGGTSISLINCYANTTTQAGFNMIGQHYSTLNACASEGSGLGYSFQNCSSIVLNGCGSEANIDRGATYPGWGFQADNSRITAIGGYDRLSFAGPWRVLNGGIFDRINFRDADAPADQTSIAALDVKTIRLPHSWALNGTGTVDTLPGFFVSLPAGQTAALAAVRYATTSGTATVSVRRNATGATGFTGLSVTSTAATTDPANVALADGDYLDLDITAVSSPVDLRVTVFVEYSV